MTVPHFLAKMSTDIETRKRVQRAEVVELVDTLAWGASEGNFVQVQVLSSVPILKNKV